MANTTTTTTTGGGSGGLGSAGGLGSSAAEGIMEGNTALPSASNELPLSSSMDSKSRVGSVMMTRSSMAGNNLLSNAIAAATMAVLGNATTSANSPVMTATNERNLSTAASGSSPAPPALVKTMTIGARSSSTQIGAPPPGSGSGTAGLVSGSNNESGKEKSKLLSRQALLAQPHSHDLIAALKLEGGVNMKLRRLNDVLKPYLKDGDVNEEMLDEAEAVRREQDRHMSLLHRNFSSLQSSLETAQHVLHDKVHNHLSDNQTLLREVNQLRSEVKSLSLENQRLAAQIDFFRTRKQDQLQGFTSQFISTDDPMNLLSNDHHYEQQQNERKKSRPSSRTYSPGQTQGGKDRGGSSATTPITFPALSAPTPTAPEIDNSNLLMMKKKSTSSAVSEVNQARRLIGSQSQSVLPNTSLSANSNNNNKSKASKTTVIPSRNKPMKSVEELLGNSLDSFHRSYDDSLKDTKNNNKQAAGGKGSNSSTTTLSKGPMTAEEKIAKIVELNFEEIRSNNKK
eukprot:scaffold7965_cov159-Ochromonas_danica.AAC.1